MRFKLLFVVSLIVLFLIPVGGFNVLLVAKAASPDVTTDLIYLGNPQASRFSTSVLTKATSRSVWDMQLFDGKIYLGVGDYEINAGPIDLYYIDTSDDSFVNEYSVPEEAVHRFRIIDGVLYMPGTDPRGSLNNGFYRYENGNWVVHHMDNLWHTFDIFGFKGDLFTVHGARDERSYFRKSVDNGATWTPIFIDYLLAVHSINRLYSLWTLAGEVYASGTLWLENSVKFSMVKYDPETNKLIGIPDAQVDSFFPGYKEGDPFLYHTFGTILYRVVNLGNSILYFPSNHRWSTFGDSIFKASSFGSATRILLPERSTPHDLIEANGTVYLLSATSTSEGHKNIVSEVSVSGVITEMFNFTTTTYARSFEYYNGNFYFGLGVDDGGVDSTMKDPNRHGSYLILPLAKVKDSGKIYRYQYENTGLDRTNPVVVIATPTAGTTYATTSTPLLVLAGTVSDDVAVASVTWSNNRGGTGIAVGTGIWSISNITLKSGANIITVTGKDSSGNTSSDSLTVTYTPPDLTAPSVSLTAPTSLANLSGSVSLKATASDNVGVVGVQFKLDTNTLIGSEDLVSPFTTTWNTTGVADGSHTLTAVARDTASNYTTSSAVLVTVDNLDRTNPVVVIATPTPTPTPTSVPTPTPVVNVTHGGGGGGGGGSSVKSIVTPTPTVTPKITTTSGDSGVTSTSTPIVSTSTLAISENISTVSTNTPVTSANISAVSAGIPAASARQNIIVPARSVLPTLTGPYEIGEKSEKVKILQKWLTLDKTIYPEQNIDGNYGPGVVRAVGRFQSKHGLALPGEAGYGQAGPLTRAKLVAVYGEQAVSSPVVDIPEAERQTRIVELKIRIIALIKILLEMLKAQVALN